MPAKSYLGAADKAALDEILLHRRVTGHTRLRLAEAASWLHIPVPEPLIRFDLRGRAAGQARVPGRGPWVIRYNPVLLDANAESFLAETVPHEVAHVIAFARHGTRIRPHGPEWRAVMLYFGVAPARCHRYAVSATSRRALPRFDYHCDCRGHQLTSIRHRRVLAGGTYLCRSCATALRPGRHQPLDQHPDPG
ncbi:MAG TPA: SprT-like domain-containing protein [Lamprocystis sp. (in: g-proteobacteria)]|nr:SprT-like domain-containing protein [Lamprocystis sp. (in: g-proteobacteria)]